MLCADSDKRGDKMLRSVIIAFSMYSRIPMPKTEWDERAMRYAMCFFPLVGAVLGATALCAAALMNALGAGDTSVFGCNDGLAYNTHRRDTYGRIY